MKKTVFLGFLAAATFGISATLVAQKAQEASAATPAPSPAALARMAPGPMHAKLETLAGNWTANGKWRMTPDAAWQEFDATVERKWILGGRFLEETVTSEFMGQPFEGIGIIGHDNTRQEFTMVWYDNMSTGITVQTGSMSGTQFVFEGQHSDPMTGMKNRYAKSLLDVSGATHVYMGYTKDEAGDEFQSMEMSATKR